MTDVSIGNELKDSFKETNSWVSNNIAFLSDVEQFYRQRSQLEKQYATDLQKLTADYLKKKANKTTAISVGDHPKVTPGSLEAASLVTWTEILSQTELIAKNHHNLSNEFNFKISDQIIALQKHLNMLNERVQNFHDNSLTKKKDEIFENVNKAKKHYDDTCTAMEQTRSKAEKSSNRDKHQKKVNEKELEMNNAKNEYLLKINIANRIKDKFYYQDLPEVLDILQDLNEFKVKQLNNILNLANNLEITNNNKDIKNLERNIQIISENKFTLDTQMFIKHNQTNWKDPQDFYYIPSSIWHDDEHFITNDHELTYLKKILLKANQTNEKYDSILETSREKLNELQTQRANFKTKSDTQDFELKPSMDSLTGYLFTLSNFVIDENVKVAAQVEIETIGNNANDKDLSLDGLRIEKKKTNFFGKLRGSKPKEKIVDVYETNTNSSTFDDSHSIRSSKSQKSQHASHFHIPSLRRNRQQSIASSHNSTGTPTAMALFAYEADGEDEISISPNEQLAVIQPDDNGWALVSKPNTGQQGLVPATYIQIDQNSAGKKKGPEVTPRKGAKKVTYVVALYDYVADGDDELSITAGQKIELLKGDDGGWTLGEVNGKSGLFPSSYVQSV